MTISIKNGIASIQTGENGFVPVVEPTPPVPPVTPSYFTYGLDNGTDPKLYGSADLAAWSTCGALPAGTTRVVYGNNVLVSIVTNLDLSYSIDKGVSWVTPSVSHFKTIDFVKDTFFAYDIWDTIFKSSNGIDWTQTELLSISGSNQIRFFYFKDKYCFIGSNTGVGSLYYELNDNAWTITPIAKGNCFLASDETIAVSDSYIVAIRNDNTAWSSPDGTIWTQIVDPHLTYLDLKIYHLNGKFWLCNSNGYYTYTIQINDSTLSIENSGIENLLSTYIQPIVIVNKFYGLVDSGTDFRIWQSPVPPATPYWSTDSTGIPSTMQLKQLLG